MSVMCPQGHSSEATDYCDQCGARIGGAPSTGPTPAAPPAGAPAGAAAQRVCPNCKASNEDGPRYCEGCGYDFVTGVMPTLDLPVPAPATGAAAAPAPTPVAAASPTAGSGWEVVVRADRAYYDRNHVDNVPFPVACPERHFDLTADRLVIGRRSASRGITPELDLSGAPQDAAISHVHAVLVNDPAAGWTIVDPGSANGTYVNDSTDSIPVNTPVPLHDGDEIHIGAWTTLALHSRGVAP
jgi:FHA domain-containing protein